MIPTLPAAALALVLLAASAAAQASSAPDAPKSPLLAETERPQFGYDDGLFLRSLDGRYELTLNGRVLFDALALGAHREPETDFFDRRNRLEFTGKFPGGFKFHMEPNFNPGGFEVEEAWLGCDVLDANARLMLGRMKAPFGLEERSAQGNIDFPRFSILHQFSPGEEHGVFLYGRTPDRHLGYDFAVYNGTAGEDTNGGKDVAVRTTWQPFAGRTDALLEHLQLGAAATYGTQDQDLTGESIVSEPKLPVIRFADGLRLDGDRARFGLEGVWYHGPWLAQAEWMHVEQHMSLGAVEHPIGFDGAYALVSHVLTGEARSFGPTQPRSPYDVETGAGRGAWIVAARASELSSDGKLESAGFTLPGAFARRIRTASLGLEWAPNEHVILRNALVHTWYSDDVQLDHGSARSEDALLVELQIDF